MPNMTGQSIGRYHILEQLGEGGMATVYQAYDTRLEADVAVKFIRTDNLPQSGLEKALQRFEREAKALAKLTHPNIVPIIDYGEYEGSPYLVMKYLPGGTLKQSLKGQPVPWQAAASLLIPIACALDYAHRQGMIHRDVKPSNILITADGAPMLTDFGIAKIIDQDAMLDLTGTSATVGTPEYMAPEQVVSKSVDQRADIYALGIVFYEMLTGRRPFEADTPMAVLFKHASEPLPRPRQFVPGLPEAVEKVLFKALAKKPEDRYQEMGDFAGALEGILGRQPITSTPAAEEKTILVSEALPKPGTPAPADRMGIPVTPVQPAQPGAPRENISAMPRKRPGARMYWIIGLVILGIAATSILGAWLWGKFRPATPTTPTTPTASPQAVVPVLIPTNSPLPPLKIGEVTDMGGVDDKSFNALGWKGVTDAIAQLGVEGKYLESSQQSDYAKNIQQMLSEKQDLIITVGFLLGVDTAAAARLNPDQKFAIIDYTYPDCFPGAVEGTDCGSATDLSNVRGLAFQTDEAAFLAGYLSAGMTKTGKIGTFGGIQLPTVTIFMKGFQAGAKYYNEKHGTTVQVLGWDNAAGAGLFTGNFTSTDDGKSFATSLVQEGADIIMPVAGPVGLGAAAYCQTSGKCLIIGVDTDWFVANPDYASIELSSVQKKIDMAVYKTIEDLVNGKFSGGTITYKLKDGGVDLAPFHNFDSQVSQTLKDEIDQVKADIIGNVITVDGVLSDR